MKKERNHNRAPGMVKLNVAMSETLKQAIKDAARRDRREMSDWVRIMLEDAVKAQQKTPPG